MRHPDIDQMMLMERRRDDLAAAAHHRMLKEAERGKQIQAGRKQQAVFGRLNETLMLWLAQFLNSIGEHMLAWSCRLQNRYTLLPQEAAESQSSPCAS